jgi:integrase/recombinase XerD
MATKRKIKVAADAELMPIGAAMEEFIIEKEAMGRSKATIDNYKQSVRLFMEYHEMSPEFTLDEINPSYFFKWIKNMEAHYVKPTAINHYLRDCRAFFYWCMAPEQGYMPKYKICLVKAQEEQLKLYTDDELEALLEKPKKPTAKRNNFTEWRCWAVVNWILATGNRCSTVVDVRIGDINFVKGEIFLRHLKNKKVQTIPLSTSLESAIKEYIRYFRKGAGSEDYLFCNVGDAALTTDALRQSYKDYCDRREVSRANLHGLRHNFAKLWIRNNGDTFRLQKMLGHSTLDMTRKYVNLFSEDLKDNFDKYNPLDNIKKNANRRKTVKVDLD